MNILSAAALPVMICLILCAALWKRIPVFDVFLEGAAGGLPMLAKLAPTLVGLMTAVKMFQASGAIDLLGEALSGVFAALRILPELLPLAILRPVTGSGSITILSDILSRCGADSIAGRCAAVIMASTETTFYTIAVYFGSAGIRKTGRTVPAALVADCTGFLLACFFVRVFFAGGG